MEDNRGSDVGIGIIISSVTISKLGITSTLHGLFISKKFFAYHLFTDFFMKLQLILGIRWESQASDKDTSWHVDLLID